MAKKRLSRKDSNNKSLEVSDNPPTSRNAKIVLLVFGIGPLLLMSLFLFANGFFAPIG